jgi:HemY protein
MIRIFIVLVLLLIALMLCAMLFDDRGYVFVEFNGWVLEMNVFSLGISLIFIFVGFMVINWMVKTSLLAASGSRNWLGNWGQRKKQRAFTTGLLALAETNYALAKTTLAKIEHEDFDGINLLAAAEVEKKLGQPEQAKAYWRMASTYEKSALAAKLCLIRDHLHQNQGEQALDLIQALTQKQQQHRVLIKLWAQALGQAGQWQTLKQQLKGWKKALGTDYAPLMQQASQGDFAEIASKEGASQLKQNWQSLPRSTRKDPAQQSAYIQQLIDQGMFTDAQQALVAYQKAGPQPLLVPLFKQIKLPQPTASIKLLETWLKQNPEDVEHLSALAHLAHHAKDMVLAEKALKKAITLGNQPQDLQLLAQIKEAQNEQSQALALYKQSMATPT